MPKVIDSCPATPDIGSDSKFCKDHSYLDKVDTQQQAKKGRITMKIDIKHMQVSTTVEDAAMDLPKNNDTSVHVGCKNAKSVDRFSERSAGVMAIVRPCGVILDYSEMLTCESPSQLFVQLLRLVCDTPSNIKFLGYDRGCEFAPFLKNLAKKGNAGAEILLEQIEYLVDRFHIKGHTTPQCDIKNQSCLYHPDLPKFSDIQDVNTECAEQCFSWLGKFKGSLKYMSLHKFHFMLQRIVYSRNDCLIRKLKKKGKLVV